MKICESPAWIPDEAVTTWNNFIVRIFDMEQSRPTVRLSDSSNWLPEEVLNIKAAEVMHERVLLFSEMGSRLFEAFESGNAPQHLWNKISDTKYFTPSEFLFAVKDAFVGDLSRLDVMTPSEKQDWLAEVAMASYRLGSLVCNTEADKIVSELCENIRLQVFEALEENGIKLPQEAKYQINSVFTNPETDVSLNILLHRLAENPSKGRQSVWDQLFDQQFKYKPVLKSPNADNAHRTYFIKYMTSFFYSKSGRPERKLVQILVRALFDADVDLRLIREIAPTGG